jgi:hypothetical protein
MEPSGRGLPAQRHKARRIASTLVRQSQLRLMLAMYLRSSMSESAMDVSSQELMLGSMIRNRSISR